MRIPGDQEINSLGGVLFILPFYRYLFHSQGDKNGLPNISSLVFLITLQHVPIGIVSNGVDVRRHFSPPLPFVHVHHLVCVDG